MKTALHVVAVVLVAASALGLALSDPRTGDASVPAPIGVGLALLTLAGAVAAALLGREWLLAPVAAGFGLLAVVRSGGADDLRQNLLALALLGLATVGFYMLAFALRTSALTRASASAVRRFAAIRIASIVTLAAVLTGLVMHLPRILGGGISARWDISYDAASFALLAGLCVAVLALAWGLTLLRFSWGKRTPQETPAETTVEKVPDAPSVPPPVLATR